MLRIITLLILGSLTGCMTVNQEMLRKVSVVPSAATGSSVELKTGEFIQQLNGEGVNRGLISNNSIAETMGTGMLRRWKSKDLIADYGVPGKLNKTPDYTMTVSGIRNEDGSIVGAVFTGLTLYLIPSSQTLTYDLDIDFVNNKAKKRYNVKVKNALTTWQQILLLPATPFFWVGSSNMIADMGDYLYEELRKQGAFEGNGGVSSDSPIPKKAVDNAKAQAINPDEDKKAVTHTTKGEPASSAPIEATQQSRPDDKMPSAKTKCTALGFKEGTKDFGNCVYQLVQ